MQSRNGTTRDSQTYGVTSAWAPNGKSVLTRVPMFGKSLPLNNDTSSNNEKVCVTKKWVRT
jgi:hypothetical protein